MHPLFLSLSFPYWKELRSPSSQNMQLSRKSDEIAQKREAKEKVMGPMQQKERDRGWN